MTTLGGGWLGRLPTSFIEAFSSAAAAVVSTVNAMGKLQGTQALSDAAGKVPGIQAALNAVAALGGNLAALLKPVEDWRNGMAIDMLLNATVTVDSMRIMCEAPCAAAAFDIEQLCIHTAGKVGALRCMHLPGKQTCLGLSHSSMLKRELPKPGLLWRTPAADPASLLLLCQDPTGWLKKVMRVAMLTLTLEDKQAQGLSARERLPVLKIPGAQAKLFTSHTMLQCLPSHLEVPPGTGAEFLGTRSC